MRHGRAQRTMWSAVSAVAIAAMAVSYVPRPAAQTKKPRWNRIIEKLEQGKSASFGGETRYIDMEHGAFSFDRLETILAENAKQKDANGIPLKTPYMRVPMDANEVPNWVITQALDVGVLAFMIPHIETKAEALKIVKAMRYPPQRGWSNARYPEPLGVRGPTSRRAAAYWGESNPVEYAKRADVWPLNPEGELFLVGQIETVSGARNIKEILTTPGLGAILLAPNDLTFSLGIGPAGGVGGEGGPGRIGLPSETERVYDEVLTVCDQQTKVVCGASGATDALLKKHKIRFVTGGA